jgi:RNA polymerase sigma factor (sigma-70 family)
VSDRPGGDGVRGEGTDGGAALPPPEARPRDVQRSSLVHLHAEHYDRLRRMAVRSLPAEDCDAAEDLVQTVFEEAMRRCLADPSFLPGLGWLRKRLASRIADRHRRTYRDRRLGLRSVSDLAVIPQGLLAAAQVASPEEDAVGRLTVERWIDRIPDPTDRAAVRLRMAGMREAEIARRLNLDPASRQVRDRLARVRRMGGPAA